MLSYPPHHCVPYYLTFPSAGEFRERFDYPTYFVFDPWHLSGRGLECTPGEVTTLSNVSAHLLNEFLYFVREFQSISTKHEHFIFTANVGMMCSVIIYVY